jgi:hypothetical protein
MVVRTEVETLLVAMQFQDRVSQILCGLENNMTQMRETLEQVHTQPLPDPGEWIDALNQSSRMNDQLYQRTHR